MLYPPMTPDPLPNPNPRRPSAGVVPGKVIFGRPVAQLGFDETGAGGYDTPSDDGYLSMPQAEFLDRAAGVANGAMSLFPGGRSRDSNAQSSNSRRRRRGQPIGQSVSNMGDHLVRGAENLFELGDHTLSVGASTIGGLAHVMEQQHRECRLPGTS